MPQLRWHRPGSRRLQLLRHPAGHVQRMPRCRNHLANDGPGSPAVTLGECAPEQEVVALLIETIEQYRRRHLWSPPRMTILRSTWDLFVRLYGQERTQEAFDAQFGPNGWCVWEPEHGAGSADDRYGAPPNVGVA